VRGGAGGGLRREHDHDHDGDQHDRFADAAGRLDAVDADGEHDADEHGDGSRR
jgi:hypothetical protein